MSSISMTERVRIFPIFVWLFGIGICLQGRADDVSDYLTQIKPLLKSRCYACHGALKQEAGLRLDTAQLILQGGDSGAAITPGPKAGKSLLLERVSEKDPAYRMPPEHEGEPLNSKQIELLRKWIAAGAHGPDDEKPEKDPSLHWAFQPVTRPKVPLVENEEWVRNPIDAFISKQHELQGLKPQVEASRMLLVRRLYLDLIGVPPTAEEIAACENDPSPQWYEQTVDRLLEDPRHGERWARHWMDNWRYSDWWGYAGQLRNSQKHIWHWRDWIVESLNKDLPYDEMVRQMLAADELYPNDPEKLRATGYLARSFYLFNRTRWLEGTVEHVGKGFLGLTFNCAKCHDHKFDPIQQEDFYQLRAFFEPYQVRLDMVPGETDLNKDGIPRVFDGLPDAPTYLFVRGDEANADKSNPLAPGIPDILAFEDLDIEPVDLPAVAWQPARREGILEAHLNLAKQRLNSAQTQLLAAQKNLKEKEKTASLVRAEAEGSEPVELVGSQLTLEEDFATLDRSRWQQFGGKWTHKPGRLEQRMDGKSRSVLRLIEQAPADFEATVRFRILGGSTWRSVGISFDATLEDPTQPPSALDTEQLVYTSGAINGSKVQAAFSQNGKWNYPSPAMKAMSIELDREYQLRVRVRGTLINASLNGKPMVAWRTPLPRREGALQLITFDCLADFLGFEIAPLDNDTEMRLPPGDAGESPTDRIAQAEAEVKSSLSKLKLAEAATALAQASLHSVQARAKAMRAAWRKDDPKTIEQATTQAVKAERKVLLVTAEQSRLKAQLALNSAVPNKKAAAEKKLKKAEAELTKAQASFDAEIKPTDQFTPLKGAKWSATRFQYTGKDDPEVSFPETSTGRRTALAHWITDPRNPLTARVAVNHLWTRHFGTPIVASTFDFGRNGSLPTHPELLDWLALEFMENHWSMKHLHRLIVMSSTYRMGSSVAGREAEMSLDPDNHFWWRRVPIRIESEVVRDAILTLSGELDGTLGGPPVPEKLQAKSKRRSLYFFHSSTDRNLFLTTFDEASVAECYRREQSIVPQQALALSNSGLVLDASAAIAKQLSATTEDDSAFVRRAFKVVLGIDADESEMAASLSALKSWKSLPKGNSETARASLIWALINHNDFVTLR